jgi:hypothetical protein
MRKRGVGLRTILFVLVIAAQGTWYTIILARLVASPWSIRQVDYVAIYPAGYIARYEGLSSVYDMKMQQRIQDAAISPLKLASLYPYNHPPYLVPILRLVTTSDYIASFYRWLVILLIFHLLSLMFLAGLFRWLGWPRKDVWLLAVAGLFFYPIFGAYLKGQDSAFVLFGVSVWSFGVLTGKDRLAGLGLGLVAMRPQVALVLALPFLFKRRKVWWWFVGWGAILLMYFYLLIGWNGVMEFTQTLFLSAAGKGIDVNAMPTLMGALVRSIPAIPAQTLNLIGYSGYVLALLFLCLVWLKSHEITARQVGLAVLISIVFSPHLHVHDLSLLLVPVLCALVVLVDEKILRQRYAIFLLLGVSVVFTVNGVFWFYPIIYLTIVLLGLLLWMPGWWKARREVVPG